MSLVFLKEVLAFLCWGVCLDGVEEKIRSAR